MLRRFGTATCLVSAGDDFCTCAAQPKPGPVASAAAPAHARDGAAAAAGPPGAGGAPALPPGAVAAVPWPSPGSELLGGPQGVLLQQGPSPNPGSGLSPNCASAPGGTPEASAPGAGAPGDEPGGSGGMLAGGGTPSAAEGGPAEVSASTAVAGGEGASVLEPTKSSLGSDLLGMLLQAAAHGAVCASAH